MTYSVADIVQLHSYLGDFVDLADDLKDSEFDCGCAEAAVADIVVELIACNSDEERAAAWMRHMIWAVREYAGT